MMMLSSSQKGWSDGRGGVGGGFGVLVPGVDGGTSDGAILEGVVEGGFVDDVPACGVNDVGGWFHESEFVSADETVSCGA